jgi:hypothetical protein
MNPGRKLKYASAEEKTEANRLKAQKYYEKNKEKIRAKNLERYHKNKINE